MSVISFAFFFFFNDPATPEIYTLSLHDALPISRRNPGCFQRILLRANPPARGDTSQIRSEEHTSELQSRGHLVCRLLLEKKKKYKNTKTQKRRNKSDNYTIQLLYTQTTHNYIDL